MFGFANLMLDQLTGRVWWGGNSRWFSFGAGAKQMVTQDIVAVDAPNTIILPLNKSLYILPLLCIGTNGNTTLPT